MAPHYVWIVTCYDIVDDYIDNAVFNSKKGAIEYYNRQKTLALELYGDLGAYEEDYFLHIPETYEQFLRKERINK